VNAVRAAWSNASFLVYVGGLTILFGTLAFLDTQSEGHGHAGFVLWSALILVVVGLLAFIALGTGHPVTAGLLALSTVAAVVVFLGSLFDWFGWLPDNSEPGFRGFHFWLLVLELVTVLAALVALAIFRFPLLVFAAAAAGWFFTTDLLSNGGDWSAIVTIIYGVVIFLVALLVDAGESRPFGLWLHVVAGATIGGGLLWFFHDGDWEWILIAAVALAYIALGDRLLRSSWAVLGAWGALQATAHFAAKWSEITAPLFYLFPFSLELDSYDERHEHAWAGPLLFGAVGLTFIGIALFLARRRREVIPAAELL
jgi:hypothetical protein